MRTLRVVIVIWLLTDCGVAVGWVLTQWFERQVSFLASVVLGTLAILFAIKRLARRGWLNPERQRGGSIGGLCGFALAAALAATLPGRPVAALSCFALVGVAAMLGAGPSAAQ